MRTREEFRKQMHDAHQCEKSEGKIFFITIDAVGNSYCGYCDALVNYPIATKEESMKWLEECKQQKQEINNKNQDECNANCKGGWL